MNILEVEGICTLNACRKHISSVLGASGEALLFGSIHLPGGKFCACVRGVGGAIF